ncbi:Formate dehydrogenase subunit alpha like [Actinidia chinensis var. chinensis]|uniref:Formate dehydrogenase subunit alpha like n=1 Tax=Actinidia chinensis var. chinensis TaxID=1590841 RepID=A0A2R6RAG3_ACTCC|nr:Formate dehydrogenase subunit alpha like [Actinidia chinensis var. chinensis]
MAAAQVSSARREMGVVRLWLLVFITVLPLCYGGRVSFSNQNFEVNKHLNRLNKPPIKSIKSPDGDVIDCVHISHQPAFDHPLLKNHTIQVRPNYHPEGRMGESKVSIPKSNEGNSKPMTQLWHMNGKCPEGTVPIRRTKTEDLLRASSIKSYGKKKRRAIPRPPRSVDPDLISQSGHQHAIAYVEGEYYGAKATMNVWEPQIQQPNEFSLSQMWILGGSFASDLNSIEAGWQVSPDLYGDNNTRLFTYWTSDAYQATGCYNLLCSGFIQINNEIAMGATIFPVSAFRGSQYDISILVWKDPKEGNWWMQFGNGYVLGYWPAYLFSYLGDSASMIEWGGEVVNSAADGQHTTTQMGSGHFPAEGFGKASYFRNIQIVDGSNNLRAPKDMDTFTEEPDCYDVQVSKTGDWGSYFYYGGPGRNPNCP